MSPHVRARAAARAVAALFVTCVAYVAHVAHAQVAVTSVLDGGNGKLRVAWTAPSSPLVSVYAIEASPLFFTERLVGGVLDSGACGCSRCHMRVGGATHVLRGRTSRMCRMAMECPLVPHQPLQQLRV